MQRAAYRFGAFTLFADSRRLVKAGRAVRLGSRASAVLRALVSRPGKIFSAEELMVHAWPGERVDAANLRINISSLRKALAGDETGSFIANIPGRGYLFVGDVQADATDEAPSPPPSDKQPPEAISRVIGRDQTVETLAGLLQTHRLVTVIGAGGMGKSTAAAAAAKAAASLFPDGVLFADLSAIERPSRLPEVLAGLLGRPLPSGDAIKEVVGALCERQILILLDSAEHLIDDVAQLVEAILSLAVGVRFLITSREPLRAAGEWVHRLEPLAYPVTGAGLTVEAAMGFAAIELFVERAAERLDGYELITNDLEAVAEICRRLDGIPLAIELAAGRLNTSSVQGLARALDDRFRVLTQDRQDALPRHQTLQAAFDWSHNLLSDQERAALRNLAVFHGFTLPAAERVLSRLGLPTASIALVMGLVSKSLVAAEVTPSGPRYRLLDSIREYAAERLVEAHEVAIASQAHAEYFLALAQHSEAQWSASSPLRWRDYELELANFRGALDWLYASQEITKAVALTVALIPLWSQLSLFSECLARAEQALGLLDTLQVDTTQWRMKLLPALSWKHPSVEAKRPDAPARLAQSLALSEALNDADYQLRSYWGLWLNATNEGLPGSALTYADTFRALAISLDDANEIAIAERLRARALYLLGDHAQALSCLDWMLAHYVLPSSRSHLVRYQHDQQINAQTVRVRILWTIGLQDQALEETKALVQAASALGHGLTLAYVLADAACPIALSCGDLQAADGYIDRLRQEAHSQSVEAWVAYADAFRGDYLIRRGDTARGARLVQSAIETLTQLNFVIHAPSMAAPLAEALLALGQDTQALALTHEMLARCEATGAQVYAPELMRVLGVVARRQGASNMTEAQRLLRNAVDLAQSQGAHAWALRAAIDLAVLLESLGQRREAKDILVDALRPIGTQQNSSDVTRAARLVASLSAPD